MLAEITNHLWQSTEFAVVVGLLTIGFRNNRAQVRYWMWLSASLKFLVPFAILLSLGSLLDRIPLSHPGHTASVVTLSVVQMSEPFLISLPLPNPVRDSHHWAAICMCGVWACGSLTIVLIRVRGVMRIRAAVRHSAPLDVPGSMEIRSSQTLLEPGVVGFFHPILLLPAGIAERLAPAQMKAVLAHELCHVRRRDNLTSAIHMIVEAAFWFHPLAWWIGARLVEERERACDEAVLSLGNEPCDYAEGILNICKSYKKSPLSCVSGVTGSHLKRRIQAILQGYIACDLTLAKKLALTAAGLAALSMPIVLGAIGVPRLRAESRLAVPKFEVVSIGTCNTFRKGTIQDWSAGILHSECTTVQRLIEQAYGLFATGRMNPGSSLRVTGGPAWTTSDLYEIDAKAESPETHTVMNGPILQAVLEQRFKLKVHRETREVPVYGVTVGAGGPKLRPFPGNCTLRDFDNLPSPADCDTSRAYGNGFEMSAATVADLCAAFSVLLDRQVMNETDIAGRFNMRLDLSPEDRGLLNRPRALPALSDPTVPPPAPVSFYGAKTAMKELGLDLEPSKGPGDFLVVDHAEKPLSD